MLSIVQNAVDGSIEAARRVQGPIRAKRHRRDVDDAAREWLARTAGNHSEDGHRRLLAATAAVGHVNAPVLVNNGTVDLMKPRCDWNADIHERSRPGQPGCLDLGRTAFQSRWNFERNAIRRGKHDRSGCDANRTFGARRGRNGKVAATQPHSAAGNDSQRFYAGEESFFNWHYSIVRS